MQVETFECTETMSEPAEASSEALELIEALGLEGQKKLCIKTPHQLDSRCPYREITADEFFVYATLCPERTPLNRYSASPVPLRVLQLAAHANQIDFIKRLEVWDRVSVQIKDPVLVGWTNQHDWYRSVGSDNRCYILARWGEELETFPVLVKRAMQVARENLIQSAEQVLNLCRTASDSAIIKAGAGAEVKFPE